MDTHHVLQVDGLIFDVVTNRVELWIEMKAQACDLDKADHQRTHFLEHMQQGGWIAHMRKRSRFLGDDGGHKLFTAKDMQHWLVPAVPAAGPPVGSTDGAGGVGGKGRLESGATDADVATEGGADVADTTSERGRGGGRTEDGKEGGLEGGLEGRPASGETLRDPRVGAEAWRRSVIMMGVGGLACMPSAIAAKVRMLTWSVDLRDDRQVIDAATAIIADLARTSLRPCGDILRDYREAGAMGNLLLFRREW